MNIYDVLRKLVELTTANGPLRTDMLAVVDDMERMNAFGTIGQQHSGQTHQCVAPPFNPQNPGQQAFCIVCGKAL